MQYGLYFPYGGLDSPIERSVVRGECRVFSGPCVGPPGLTPLLVNDAAMTTDAAGDERDTDESAAAGHAGGADPGEDPDATYGGLLGAIRYAYRTSESRLVRTYVVVGTLLAALVVVLFVQALVVLLGGSVGITGGTFTFSRAFFVVVALAVVGPLLAPIISIARRHRRGAPDERTDRTLAALGFLYVLALYVTLVISAPPALREPVDGTIAPVIETLYALPPYAGVVPPAAIAAAMWIVHRRAPS